MLSASKSVAFGFRRPVLEYQSLHRGCALRTAGMAIATAVQRAPAQLSFRICNPVEVSVASRSALPRLKMASMVVALSEYRLSRQVVSCHSIRRAESKQLVRRRRVRPLVNPDTMVVALSDHGIFGSGERGGGGWQLPCLRRRPERSQYSWSQQRRVRLHGFALLPIYAWWLRSPQADRTQHFRGVKENGGTATSGYPDLTASSAARVAFCFSVLRYDSA